MTEDAVDAFETPHRTTLSRYAVAKTAYLKAGIQSKIDTDEVKSLAVMIDGSKRKKKDHAPSGGTYSCGGKVEASLLSDTVTTGKTGFNQAKHMWSQLSPAGKKKLRAILFDTTSSNTGKLHGLAAELERLAERDLMLVRCQLHVLSLLMVAFGVTLCGETPSLHTLSGSGTPPNAVALLLQLFLHYLEGREWKDLKEAYFTLWTPHERYCARAKPVFSRWKYVTKAAIQHRKRCGKTIAMALLKTTQLRGLEFTGREIPDVQPIARLGCSASGCEGGC